MKQERINKTVIFLGIFLMISSKAFGVTAFDPNNVSGSVNTATGGVRLSYSGTPTYDAQNDTYNVPTVIGEEVSAPDPARAAQGDATSKPVIVGNPVTMTLPGTDLVKLADGTWTNEGASPSETLSTALATVTEQPDTVDTAAVGDVFSADGEQTCRRITDKVSLPINGTSGVNCAGLAAGYPYSTPFGPSQTSMIDNFCVMGPCTDELQANGILYNFSYTKHCIMSVSAPCPSTYHPDGTSPGSSDLANALIPALPDWGNNGIAEDFKKAAENGAPSIDGLGPTSADIDNWKLQNQSNVNNTISSGLGSGIGPDGKRPCRDQGTQGP